MANWSTLKAAVAKVIKTNGNQEITGAVLQNALNNIISNVGENATFAGIATPSTNPGAPDGNVFYLATKAGTYSNFNGIEIASGEAIILEWRGKWVKKNSGFATQQKLSEVGSIGTINVKDIEFLNGNIKLKANNNYYIFTGDGKMIKYVPTSDENYDILDFGALVYNTFTSSIESVAYFDIEYYHIILLFHNPNEQYPLIGGQWYNSYFQRLIRDKFIGFNELLKNNICNIGTVNNVGFKVDYASQKIQITLLKDIPYYIFKGSEMIKYTPASNEVYTIADYGALVYNLETEILEAVVYNQIEVGKHLILLFVNRKEPNYIAGGQWYNSYFQRSQIIYRLPMLNNTNIGRISSIDGSIQDGNESRYVEIDVKGKLCVKYKATVYSGNYGYAFFDSDGGFILGVKTTETKDILVEIPNNAALMRLSYNLNYVNDPNIFIDEYGVLLIDSIKGVKDNFFFNTENLVISDNIIKQSDIELGKYVRHDGTEGSAKNWYRTGYIEVEEGEIYTAFDYRTSHVALYNSEKVIQPDTNWQSGEEIPAGIKYIRLNQEVRDTEELTMDMVKIALVKGIAYSNPGFILSFNPDKIKIPNGSTENMPFKGKGVFCAGDSQTMHGLYFSELLRVTGMKMIGNTGLLGNGGTSTNLLGFLKRMDSQGLIKWDDIDVFTVLIGGNDYGSNTEKGTFNDVSGANTIYGSIKGVIDYVMSKKSTITMAFFTRPERDNVENTKNQNGYWFTTKKLQGVTKVIYTGNVEPSSGCTDGGVAICGYDGEGNFVKNILEAKGSGYTSESVSIPSECKQIRICSKGSAAGETFSFEITSDGTSIPSGTILNESNIDEYREKSSNVLPKGYILNNSYYNIYIWKDGYCDNRSYHYAPGPNLKGNTMYDIGEAICDCARRMGVPCLDTHNMCNVVYGYNLRDLMPDGTHFNQTLGSKIGRLMGNYINTLY